MLQPMITVIRPVSTSRDVPGVGALPAAGRHGGGALAALLATAASVVAAAAGVVVVVVVVASIDGPPPAAAGLRPNLAQRATVIARSRIRGPQADAKRTVDGDPKTWWSTGPGDLALNPVDLDLRLNAPHVVDTLVVVTTRLKGQLRLKDFDLFGGLDGAWDGAHPLAKVRGNREASVRVRFPAVRLDRLRLRLLGSHRPDNAFAHVAELAVYEATGQPQRRIEASPFPLNPADAGHDPTVLRALIQSLQGQSAGSPAVRARLNALRTRLRLIEESQRYEAMLERIGADTERFRKLVPPPWALAQRDAMARLRTWAWYWIDHQRPDGQFGAGYEDDVELVCGWPVLVLAQDDRKVRRALERLADGVWHSRPYLERFGYDRLSDVEHAAENTSYSQPRMVVIDWQEGKWAERCRRTAATMREHFLSRNRRGWLQFRSDYFGFDPKTLRPVTREKDRPFDIAESAKALKPAMYAVWYSGDPECKQLMLDYGRTWGQAAATGGPGRMPGLLPVRILWPSGQPVGTHAMLSSMRATLFHLIGCYYVAGDPSYLRPVRSLLQKALRDWSVKDVPSAGTLDQVRDEDWTGLLEQLALLAVLYRQAAGDRQFDPELARWARRIKDTLVDGVKSYVLLNRNSDRLWYLDRPLDVGAYRESRCTVGAQLYMGWLVTGDDDYLATLGWNLSSCLTDKWGAFSYWFYDKSERRVTSNDHLAHKIQGSESALCLMYLGGPGPVEAVWPQFAVTWQEVGENFCALVRAHGPDRLLAHLYCFDEQPRQVAANLWELAPGQYQATVSTDADQDGRADAVVWRGTVDVQARGQAGRHRQPVAVRFTLPARTLCYFQVSRQSAAGTGAAATPARRPVAVVVGPSAPPLGRFAAAELCRYLDKLFGLSTTPTTTLPPDAEAALLVGTPATNPAVKQALGPTGWPKLSRQGILLKRTNVARPLGGRKGDATLPPPGRNTNPPRHPTTVPALVIGGGSPVATMWAAYELAERWGVRFLIDRDALPPKRIWPGLPNIDLAMEPNMPIRCWRLVNDLAHGPVSWSLAENRRFLRQIAKMKYNRIHVSLWPTQPFVHYTFRGLAKPPGVLYFGQRHRIDSDTIGREKFGRMKVFTNPELVGADSPQELRRRAIGLVRGILQQARHLGMETGLSIQPFEWPKEFMKVLPGSQPARQLGSLTAGPGPSQSIDDPLLRDMVATIVRAYVETYPQIDYLHVGMPEHRTWTAQAAEAYRRLDARYKLHELGSYQRLCQAARSRTTFPGGGQRVEAMLKGDLAALCFFDSLLRRRQLLRRPGGGPDIKIVYNGVVAELFPLVARMVPPGGELLSFIDYTASRQLQQRELLRQVPPRQVPACLIFTLADDNVGVLPQLATGSLHQLMGELRANGWAGFYTRYWTVGDLDPTVHYLARASWDASLRPQRAYTDLVRHVCGPEAVEPALAAFDLIERITLDLDQHALGFGFPVPGMMTKHYRSGGLSEPIRRDHRLYRQALDHMQRALEQSRPEGRDWLRYFAGRLRFAVRYLDAAEAFGATYRAEKAGRLDEARRHIRAACTAIRDALQAYADVAKDHGDLGAVALMTEYCYRPIRDKQRKLLGLHRKEQ